MNGQRNGYLKKRHERLLRKGDFIEDLKEYSDYNAAFCAFVDKQNFVNRLRIAFRVIRGIL